MKRVLQIAAVLLAATALIQTAHKAFAGKLDSIIQLPHGSGDSPGP